MHTVTLYIQTHIPVIPGILHTCAACPDAGKHRDSDKPLFVNPLQTTPTTLQLILYGLGPT